MAKRRMLMENIVESDDFASLSHVAQALYLHLNMCADDDGFVGNAARIMRSHRIQKKQLDLLVEKGYVITFDSGVAVITHWLYHNKIKSDRYTPTRYKEERRYITVVDGALYEKLSNPEENQGVSDFFGNNSDPQYSIGKGSKGEDSQGEIREEKERKEYANPAERSEVNKSLKKERKDESSVAKLREADKRSVFTPSMNDLLKKGTAFGEHSFLKEINIENNIEKGRIISADPILLNEFKLHVAAYSEGKYNNSKHLGFLDHYEKKNWMHANGSYVFLDWQKHVDDYQDIYNSDIDDDLEEDSEEL